MNTFSYVSTKTYVVGTVFTIGIQRDGSEQTVDQDEMPQNACLIRVYTAIHPAIFRHNIG